MTLDEQVREELARLNYPIRPVQELNDKELEERIAAESRLIRTRGRELDQMQAKVVAIGQALGESLTEKELRGYPIR